MTQINGSRSIMIMDKDVETCAQQQGMSLKRTRKSMIIQRLSLAQDGKKEVR